MTERPRLPLTFGSGLDRATGILAAAPDRMRDLRNVYLYRNKLQPRRGIAVVNSFDDESMTDVDDIVLVHASQAEQIGIVVGHAADGELHVYRVDGEDGTGDDRLGAWFTLNSQAISPPRVIAAEQYRKVFLAHDEPQFPVRASTFYYDPFAAPVLQELEADLDRDSTPAPIHFRGVARYLQYLVGWGYGNETDPDRAEMVRVSLPGNPLGWEPEHYFLAGLGDDPVLNCLPAADGLVVFKGSEQHGITGYDRRTFGIRPGEQLYGLAGSRLALSLNTVIYFWSLEGPRRRQTVFGPSEDLAWPLELDAPSPADLVAAGDVFQGFSVYVPGRRAILFVFGARVYQLNLWNPAEPKWSYAELGVPAFSGGLLYGGGEVTLGAPQGFADNLVVTAVMATTDTLNIEWDNNDFLGDEFVELWYEEDGTDVWTLHHSVQVTTATQDEDIDGLDPGTDYNVALRYRRGPFVTPGYTSSDPDDWPAASKGSGTTNIDAPVLDQTTWERVDGSTERGNVTFTPAHAAVDVVVRRDSVEIATVTAAQHMGAQFVYQDTGITGEAYNDYDCLHRTADADSGLSNQITQWGGPFPGPTFVSLDSVEAEEWELVWTNGNGAWQTEVWLENVTDMEGPALRQTESAGTTMAQNTEPGDGGDTVRLDARHKLTQFAVDDFSPFFDGNAGFMGEEVVLSS